MPVYTCTTTTSTLTAEVKSALAQEISRIHAEINHVPSTYVNVVFHELPRRRDLYRRRARKSGACQQLGPIRSPIRRNNPSRNGNRSCRVSDLQRRPRPGNDGDPKQPREWRRRRRPRPARARPRAGVGRRSMTSPYRERIETTCPPILVTFKTRSMLRRYTE